MRFTYPGELRTGSLKQNGNQIRTKLICWKIGKPVQRPGSLKQNGEPNGGPIGFVAKLKNPNKDPVHLSQSWIIII